MERRIDSTELKSSLEELLQLTTMTIATAGRGGEPHAAEVYFACDELLNLYFFSDTSSQHSLDTDRDSRAAVTVHAEGSGWQEIHGLQMRGVISAVQSKSERQGAWDLYRTKFPFVIDLEEIITTNQLYAFKPYWIRLVDNRQGFGFKQEWEKSSADDVRKESPGWRLLTNKQRITGNTNG
jgi:uncharacterized protein YhbP (UPF0306 family)